MYNEENYDNYEDENIEEEEQSGGSKIKEIYYNNKKLIWLLGIIILVIIIVSIFNGKGGGSSNDNSVVGPVNKPERVQLSKSKELKVKVRGQEYRGSYDNLSWNSRNTKIVDVDSTGIITGKSIGKTIINGVYTENNVPYSFVVDVVVFKGNENTKLQNVDFNGRSLVMNIGVHDFSLSDKLNVSPEDGYVYDVIYTSSNPSVAIVDDAGIVQGISSGKSTITASINDSSKEALIDVYVKEDVLQPKLIKIPQKIEFEDGTTLKLELNGSKELKLAPSPSDASSEFISWTSSDESVVAITADGIVSGVKLGKATITAKALNGIEGKLLVEVVQETVGVDSITVTPSSITMRTGESRTLIPTVKPDNASNKALTFDSSNTAVVSVVPTSTKTSATIYAGTTGTAVVTIKSDNGKVATLTVTVNGSGGNNPNPSNPVNESGSIKVRLSNSEVSDKTPKKSCDGTAVDYYRGPLTVTIGVYEGDVGYVAYCYTKGCTPDENKKEQISKSKPVSFTIPNGGTYILRVKKYNSSGKEISSSNSNNYVDGSLVYYINTKQAGLACTSKSTWESGGSTAVSSGACYVNTNSRGVTNGFVWKEAGSSLGSYTNLAETVITTKTLCERANNNANGTRNLCFRNGNKYYFGSQYAVKNAYPNNTYVSTVIEERACTSSDSSTGNKLSNIGIEVVGGGNNVSVEVGKVKEVKINLNPTTVDEDVIIKKECKNGGDFTVDKSKTRTSTTIKITGKTSGNCELKVIGSNGNGISKTLSVQVWSINNIPLDGGQSA